MTDDLVVGFVLLVMGQHNRVFGGWDGVSGHLFVVVFPTVPESFQCVGATEVDQVGQAADAGGLQAGHATGAEVVQAEEPHQVFELAIDITVSGLKQELLDGLLDVPGQCGDGDRVPGGLNERLLHVAGQPREPGVSVDHTGHDIA